MGLTSGMSKTKLFYFHCGVLKSIGCELSPKLELQFLQFFKFAS